MEHFHIVNALCRSAMGKPNSAIRHQVERLRDELIKDGETKQAASLTKILNSQERQKYISPDQIVQSNVNLPSENLSENAIVPVDRETSAPLAEIIFPSDITETKPLFNSTVSQAINSVIEEWSHADKLSKYGIAPAKSCVIYGVPGSGKTRLAHWIAKQLELPIVLIRIDGLVSSFLGTTAKNVANLFNFANRYRCVLLLDEFDAIAKVRDDNHEVGEIKRVVNALLQNLDKRSDIGITIGITNHPRLLDPAVWRRFEIQLSIPEPDFERRKAIANHFLPPLKLPDMFVKLIAWFTEGASGSDVESLVRTYQKNSLIRGEQFDLLDSMRQFATLNSARISEERRDLIFGDIKKLFKSMRDDPQLKFSIVEIAELAGKDKSTISRWLGKDAVVAK